MASGWLSGNCELVIAPICWSRDNGTYDFVSGGIPTWPTGAYQPVQLSGFTSNCGYIYGNPGFGKIHFDGTSNPSGIMTNYELTLSDASALTWETLIHYEDNTDPQIIMSAWEDSNNYVRFYIYQDSTLRMKYRKGGVTKIISSSDTLNTHNYYHLATTKEGGTTRLYINGSEVVYGDQPTYNLGNYTVGEKLVLGSQLQKGYTKYPLSGDIYWAAIYSDALSSGAITHHATELDYGMDMVGTSGGIMEMDLVAWPSGVDPSGISLPTHGLGATLANLASFGYGGDGSEYYSKSYYDADGKSIVRAIRQSSGPVIFKEKSDGSYLGKYYLNIIAQKDGRYLKDTQWTYYAENIADISGITPTFMLYPQDTAMQTDKHGVSRLCVKIPEASGLPDFFDKTGTSGQYISMWAVGSDGEHISQRIDIEYRIVDGN